MNFTFTEFEKLFGGEAGEKWAEVCQAGGFGTVSQSHEGGLDVSGLPAEVRKKIDAIVQPKNKFKGDNE